MLLRDLIDVLEAIAPTRHAEPWDNVGLLVGDPAQPVTRAMLTIDYTPEVAAEAAARAVRRGRRVPPADLQAAACRASRRRAGARCRSTRSAGAWRSTRRTRRWTSPTAGRTTCWPTRSGWPPMAAGR